MPSMLANQRLIDTTLGRVYGLVALFVGALAAVVIYRFPERVPASINVGIERRGRFEYAFGAGFLWPIVLGFGVGLGLVVLVERLIGRRP